MYNPHKKNRTGSLHFEALEPRQMLTTFYVDGAGGDGSVGSDSNDGTSLTTPFATLQHAANLAQPGDTVLIRGGVYRETVNVPRSGTAANPITFQAYNNEDVVVSSADLITGWQLVAGDANQDGVVNSKDNDIWRATVNWDVGSTSSDLIRDANTLFVDGEVRYEAREKGENDLLDVNDWGQVPRGRLVSGSNTVQLDDLTGFGDDYWNGAKIFLQLQDWSYSTFTITDYVSSTGTITLDQTLSIRPAKVDHLYYIGDTSHALDSAGEWYKERGNNSLYYKAEPGQDPNSLEIEFRRRTYGFDVSNRDHIHISGLTFRGGAIETTSGTDHNVYQGNQFYAYDRGSEGRFYIRGEENVFRDNEVSRTWGGGIWVQGSRHDIVNNYFHDIGWDPITRVFYFENASEILVSRNTFRKWSRSVVGSYPQRSEFSYNLIENGGNTTWDTAVFDSDGSNGTNSFSIIHHNVIRNFETRGIFEAFYGRSDNQVIHHNIVYDFSGSVTYSGRGTDFRQAYHNTFVGVAPDGTQSARNAVQTRYNNNLQISLDEISAIGVDVRGNVNYSPSDFIDFSNDDFRLAAGSSAIDAGIVISGINDGENGSQAFFGSAPDAGAIEFDPSNPNAPAWTDHVGHDFVNPPSPIYSWTALPGTNLNDNATFVSGYGDWTVASGSPTIANYNSWNLKGAGDGRFLELTNNSLTGTFNSQSIELEPTEAVQRTFTGLRPDTIYTFGSAVRVIDEVVTRGNQFNGQSGSVSTGQYRDQFYATGLTAGEWIRFDNIDFGDPGQFDEIEILLSRNAQLNPIDGTIVQIRLDSPNGPLLANFDKPIDDWFWYKQRADMPATSGVHSIYVSVSGTNAANVAASSIRLLKKDLLEQDKALVTVSSGSQTTTARVGSSRWLDEYETFTFQTGPSATTATITLSNDGRTDAYFDKAYLAEGDLIPADPENLARLAGLASQSSTQGTFRASRAIDDDMTASYSQTQDSSSSWWQVSFPQKFGVGQIELTNVDTSSFGNLSDFTVSVWNGDPDAGGVQLWSKAYFESTGSVASGGTLQISAGELADDGVTRLSSAYGDVVRVQLNGLNNNGNGVLALEDVRIVESANVQAPSNLARSGIAQQSSDFRGAWDLADVANNGLINPDDVITTTKNESQAWWQVDLLQPSDIEQIVIYNRRNVPNRLDNFRVSVWSDNPNTGGTELWGRDYNYSSSAGPISTSAIGTEGALRIDGSTTGSNGQRLENVDNGRYVRVQLNGSNFLSLSEVQVWSDSVVPSVPPIAANDVATTDEDQSVTIDVLDNDSDPDSTIDPTTVSIVSGPANGSVSVNSTTGEVTYTPDFRYSGNDSFTYTVRDTGGIASNLAVVNITINDLPAPTAFLETGGLVVFEAENFTGSASGSGAASSSQWQPLSDAAASGGTALIANPNVGVNTGSELDGPRLDYEIEFQTAGTYRVYVRTLGNGGLNNSVHVGLNGFAVTTNGGQGLGDASGNWVWVDDVSNGGLQNVTIEVPSPGRHIFNIWMREDGTQIDKVVLDQSAITPTGFGPLQSPFVDEPTTPGDFNDDRQVDHLDRQIWQSAYGINDTADSDEDGDTDGYDFLVWQRNYETPAPTETFKLVDASNGNGGLLTTTTAADNGASSTGTASTNNTAGLVTNDNGRALVSSADSNIYVDIPGWRSQRVSYTGGNSAFGFDGSPDLSVGSEPAQYAFVNSGLITLTSNAIAGNFSAGSVFDLSFLAEITDAAAGGNITATLNFDNGESTTFSTLTNIGAIAVEFSESYTLQNNANTVEIRLLMEAINNAQLKVDGVALDVTTTMAPLSQQAALIRVDEPQDELAIALAPAILDVFDVEGSETQLEDEGDGLPVATLSTEEIDLAFDGISATFFEISSAEESSSIASEKEHEDTLTPWLDDHLLESVL